MLIFYTRCRPVTPQVPNMEGKDRGTAELGGPLGVLYNKKDPHRSIKGVS